MIPSIVGNNLHYSYRGGRPSTDVLMTLGPLPQGEVGAPFYRFFYHRYIYVWLQSLVFSSILFINRVLILAILVRNRVRFFAF